MSLLIKLTDAERVSELLIVDPGRVVAALAHSDGTHVYLDAGNTTIKVIVVESPQEVMKLVNKARVDRLRPTKFNAERTK